jgi:hypothetical protein
VRSPNAGEKRVCAPPAGRVTGRGGDGRDQRPGDEGARRAAGGARPAKRADANLFFFFWPVTGAETHRTYPPLHLPSRERGKRAVCPSVQERACRRHTAATCTSCVLPSCARATYRPVEAPGRRDARQNCSRTFTSDEARGRAGLAGAVRCRPACQQPSGNPLVRVVRV